MPDSVRIMVFTKAPVAGQVKTRFCPPLDLDQAAELSDQFCKQTLENLSQFKSADIELWTAIDARHPAILSHARQFETPVYEQTGATLGQRMHNAFESGRLPAVVIGCDVPHCPTDLLQQAIDEVAAGNEIVGPTHDGGYYLLGLQRSAPEFFEDIEWGGTSVLEATLEISHNTNRPLTQLEQLNDLDTMEDLSAEIDRLPSFKHWLR